MTSFWLLICLLASAYGFVYLLHYATLRSRLSFRYVLFLQKTGLEIRLFLLKWNTHVLNRTFSRLGTWRPSILRIWFNTGALVSSLLVLPAMILLLQTLISSLMTVFSVQPDQDSNRIVLQPVLPGVNLPASELGYYFVTLLVCSVLHEAGHAVAAVSEDVRVLSFGAFVLLVLPAAFVDLPTDQLLALRPLQQLRVFAAGVWHNVVLAALAYLLLFSIPALSWPAYEHGKGVAVYRVEPDSPVKGPTGLEVGDVVLAVNQCEVLSKGQWRSCLVRAMIEPTPSLCMSKEAIANMDTSSGSSGTSSELECCESGVIKSSLCFVDVSKSAGWKQYACLPVRDALERSGLRCNASYPCHADSDGMEYCMQPSLGNHSRLLRVTRRDTQDFLFVGSPAEVYQSTQVSDYVPLPYVAGFLPAQLPEMLEIFLHYLAGFSGALGVLNVVPCFLLDGQHMTRVIVDIFLSGRDSALRSVVTLTFTIVGSVLLVLNMIVGLWQLL